MKYYLLAGEASGDLHGANLANAICKIDSNAQLQGWGGERMQHAGVKLTKHYKELAFMGFIEVISNIRTIQKNFKISKQDILSFKPDVLILIDYPGFNLRMAKWAKENNLRVVYYISPQVWAWKEKRVLKVKKYVDRMLVILPFEKAFYHSWGIEVDYVGHPLIEAIEDYQSKAETDITDSLVNSKNKKIIALLPGSRKQEILAKLPIMLQASNHFPDYDFVVAKAPGMDEHFYDTLLEPFPNVRYTSNKTYDLLSKATSACVTSGTATLETALFGVPEVVCYKGNPLSYFIAKLLIKIKYICLVNLIMDKAVVKELIQHEYTVENLSRELKEILENNNRISQIQSDYKLLREKLTAGGHASNNAADIIYKLISEK